MDDYIFSFCHIVNNNDYLSAIWSEPVLHDNNIIFNPFNNSKYDLSPPKWSPTDCRYLTLDEYACIQHKSSNFTLLQVNCRSLSKNFESLKSSVLHNSTTPSVIAVCETWLKDGDDLFYNLPGYKFVSIPRKIKRGGGVGLYISSCLSFVVKHEFMSILNDVCEYVVVDIVFEDGPPITIVSLYKPIRYTHITKYFFLV